MTSLGIVLHVNGTVIFANPALGRILGLAEPEKLSGRNILELVAPDDRERARGVLKRKEEMAFTEVRLSRTDGSSFDAEVIALPLVYQERDAVMVVIRDMAEGRRAEEASGKRLRELEEKSNRLEQTLKVVLSHRDEEKEEAEKTILDNVRKLVFPYIERMKAGHLTDNQLAYMETIEANLDHIISPFLRKMTSLCPTFTPTETQIAALIKEGKTTKQIARMLNVATGTVHAHRNSIRAKLKINNEEVNLRSYLLSLE
jgi:PAS domain S-box-containing protein